jgi:hypothetical protein
VENIEYELNVKLGFLLGGDWKLCDDLLAMEFVDFG